MFDHAGTSLDAHLRNKAYRELVDTIKETFVSEMIQELQQSPAFDRMIDDLVKKRTDPLTLCEQIVRERMKKCVT